MKQNENIIDVPVTEIVEVNQQDEEYANVLDLKDVGYMVMVGRTLDGQTFFRTMNINDLVMIRGLIEYGLDEVKAEIAKQRN